MPKESSTAIIIDVIGAIYSNVNNLPINTVLLCAYTRQPIVNIMEWYFGHISFKKI